MAVVTKSKKANDQMKVKLVNLLKTIFQFEDQDLDFGIYRIMNQKREDIQKFIEKELIEKIVEQLELVGEEQKKEIAKELGELKTKVIEAYTKDAFENGELKAEFAKLPLGKKYTEKLKEIESIENTENLEREIYNHIYSFFSRYYDKGDFLSQRKYTHKGNERYAIPYDGEEVLLHWANKDQYYIKSTLNFQKYAFESNGLNVIFRIVTAEEEKGNIEADENKYFVIFEKKPYEFKEGNLNIYFEYRPLTDSEKDERKFGKKTQISQSDVNEYDYEFLKKILEKGQKTQHLFKTENGKTILEKNLHKYTTSNKADYFIHKNLENFLRRELDFYLKNEVMKLEDLESDDMQKKLLKAKVIRNISMKIIDFLSQIENFQKKLWKKKKMVIVTDYIITLDKIIEYAGKEFYDKIIQTILKNKEQTREWKELFSIEVKDTKSFLAKFKDSETSEYSKLPIDTRYFEDEFKLELLGFITKEHNLESLIDGMLIKSDNFHALNLLSKRYYEQIECVYIDPPFNSGYSEILYKNQYKHSSWLSLMENRLSLSKDFLTKGGLVGVAIDDYEGNRMKLLLDFIFQPENRIGMITVMHNPRGRSDDKFIATSHEYLLLYSNNIALAETHNLPSSDEVLKVYNKRDTISRYRELPFRRSGSNSRREDRPNLFYPIFYNPENNEFSLKKVNQSFVKILPMDSKGEFRVWRWYPGTAEKKFGDLVVKKREGKYSIYVKDRIKFDRKPKSVWYASKYDASSHGTILLQKLFNKNVFSYPKSLYTVIDSLTIMTNSDSIIIDFFAGSGTTAHAVMELNRDDNSNRKFILVEMADYFDTVMIPRIKKVAYSYDWKDGKPTATNGIGIFCKYHYIEQYEDALENIEFEQKTMEEFSDYFVKYMLDFETKDSNTFLNIKKIENPFNYKLKILETVGNPPKTVTVDLVETFNYLIGLEVEKIRVKQKNGRTYFFVIGISAGHKKTLVVWRPLNNIDFKKDREIVEKIRDEFEADEVYINGDAAVKGFNQIESKFKAFLWD